MNMQYKIAKIVTRNTNHQMVPSKINAHDFVVVENIGDNHLVVSEIIAITEPAK